MTEKATKESGLQRHIGIKKYGKKGFEELQAAGREGASEKEKGAIKDKHLPKKKTNEGLSSKVEHLVSQKDELEKMLITIQTNMIDQLTLLGANAFDTIYHKKKKCTCGKDECKCEGK